MTQARRGPRRLAQPRRARPRGRGVVRALAIDVGTTSVRTALVDQHGVVRHAHQRRLTVATPLPGEVELDAREIGATVIELARRTLDEGDGCDVVGVTNQRATTI